MIAGADGPHRLPAGHRVLNQLWRRGLPPWVRGTAVHATTPLAPAVAGIFPFTYPEPKPFATL